MAKKKLPKAQNGQTAIRKVAIGDSVSVKNPSGSNLLLKKPIAQDSTRSESIKKLEKKVQNYKKGGSIKRKK